MTASNNTHQQQKKQKKAVSFSSAVRVKLVPHYNDYNDEQLQQIWFTREEMNEIRDAIKKERKDAIAATKLAAVASSPRPQALRKKTVKTLRRTSLESAKNNAEGSMFNMKLRTTKRPAVITATVQQGGANADKSLRRAQSTRFSLFSARQ